ncbi:MAG: hypothetical protein EBV19_03185 [Flavobacteriia bacterium]|nr:hypothetical protein [Flavobacteriia bacterium]
MNIIVGSTEGTVKKGITLNLADLINSIKTDHEGSVDSWWDNVFYDLQLDMEIIEEGEYGDNLEFFIQDENGTVHHDSFEYLTHMVG